MEYGIIEKLKWTGISAKHEKIVILEGDGFMHDIEGAYGCCTDDKDSGCGD